MQDPFLLASTTTPPRPCLHHNSFETMAYRRTGSMQVAMGDHFDAVPHAPTVKHALLCHGSNLTGTQAAFAFIPDLVAGISRQAALRER